MIVLFDTDAIIEYLRGNGDVVNYIDSIGGDENIIFSSVTFGEALLFANDKKHLVQIKKELDDLLLIDINESISEIFRGHMDLYALSHRPSIPDMLNASFAKHYDIDFFTLNLTDYSFIQGLKLIQHTIKPMPRRRGFW